MDRENAKFYWKQTPEDVEIWCYILPGIRFLKQVYRGIYYAQYYCRMWGGWNGLCGEKLGYREEKEKVGTCDKTKHFAG